KNGVKPDFIAGHSLGEITSLGAAGVVTPKVCLSIAIKRGQLMDKVAEMYKGGMLAVMFISQKEIKKILEELKVGSTVVIANYNAPDQTVLSGEKEVLEKIKTILSQKNGKCLWINVVGPWHSPFMKEAEKEFEKWAYNIQFKEPKIPIIFNGTGEIENNPQIIKERITLQLSHPVYWDKCMAKLKKEEVDMFFEIGPQKILSGLLRANGFKGCKIYNINGKDSIVRCLEEGYIKSCG
ncbi:MAG: ACP S-malonyltransferase, partial [Chitinispirillaceae bacterium]|nr:ACP S-malonyltransferase [Chitinispirillaceae bacterium]